MTRTRAQIAQRLTRSSGSLSTAALTRMEQDMPWVMELPAQDRSFIGLIVQAGIKSFIDWYRHDEAASPISAEVFGVAPQEMAGEVTLQQTVAMVRLSITVVDENLDDALGEDAESVRSALNRYAREIAFATAEVYARAAEQRGAWDARLEALVVDSLLRGEGDETISSRASALGWEATGNVLVMMGGLGERSALEQVRRIARDRGVGCLSAVQGDRLVVVLGGVDELGKSAAAVAVAFAPGAVVIGPMVSSLTEAKISADAAHSGLRVAIGWPDAPRPVQADDLLPERALAGDADARRALLEQVFAPLAAAGGAVLETVESYLSQGSSIEATGRALFVHANTVRYRLKRATELTGLSPSHPRDSYTLRLALTLGRLDPPEL
ncbi:PucR family transcriptional regulator [Nocardioides marmoriginsengisoli]|uniref:PucR family transcriptional regulator n=1 Tax=Nocardioides marmoriginsengisoli TaxID=661483 RepID=UPI001FE5C295|nr:helix-turn-helix domain-containing protein [Nocardioides marmoriginsengisoli]